MPTTPQLDFQVGDRVIFVDEPDVRFTYVVEPLSVAEVVPVPPESQVSAGHHQWLVLKDALNRPLHTGGPEKYPQKFSGLLLKKVD